MSILSPEQITHFEDEGYLLLANFIPADVIEAANAEIDDLLRPGCNRLRDTTVDIVHGPKNGQRVTIADLEASDTYGPVKINDLYRSSPAIRACNQHQGLLNAIAQILEGDPAICNSLNFLFGSQQPPHIDTWYMPPPVVNSMVVASVALDVQSVWNGQLVFWPKSHKIGPYRFSHGGLHRAADEGAKCDSYIAKAVTEHKLTESRLHARPGDVFLWHAQMLHGGTKIIDSSMRRRSLVTHYWRANDLPSEAVEHTGLGYALKKAA